MANKQVVVIIVVVLIAIYWVYKSYAGTMEMMSNTDGIRYKVTFVSNWGSDQNQINFPLNPHTGNMFLTVSNDDFNLFQVGQLASKAISNTSMYGTIDDLMNMVKNDRNVDSVYTAPVLETPGDHTFIITPDANYRYLSFVTMIAPSPDWFTGVTGFDLVQNMRWIQQAVIPLFVFDAGTDSGTKFNMEHFIKARPDPITLKNDDFLYPDGMLKPIAFLAVERI